MRTEIQFTGNGVGGADPDHVPEGCTCTQWKIEDDIYDSLPQGDPSADAYDAMDLLTKTLEARQAARRAQEEFKRDVKE